jgi:hypothetical protein
MKALKPLFMLLLVCAGMQAQTITEKDLLGEWHIVKFDFSGITGNLETGEVTVSDPDLEATPDDINFVKNILTGPEGEELKKGRLIVKEGLVVDILEKGRTETGSYQLINENGAQLMKMRVDHDTIKLFIALKDGELSLSSPEVGKTIFL